MLTFIFIHFILFNASKNTMNRSHYYFLFIDEENQVQGSWVRISDSQLKIYA